MTIKIKNRTDAYEIAYGAGKDAANRNMRKHGRKAWTRDDYNIAARETNRILDQLGYE